MIRPDVFRDAAHRADGMTVAELLALHGRCGLPAPLLVLAVLCTLPLVGVGSALVSPLLALTWRWPRGRGAVGPGGMTARLHGCACWGAGRATA